VPARWATCLRNHFKWYLFALKQEDEAMQTIELTLYLN